MTMGEASLEEVRNSLGDGEEREMFGVDMGSIFEKWRKFKYIKMEELWAETLSV
jgi:hypothetical protein